MTARPVVALLIALDTLMLVAVVVLRGKHPPGHDEVNVLETGLRMLGAYGNPEHFLHGSFLYDVTAVMHGLVFAATGLVGGGWDQHRYLQSYLESRDLFLLAGRLLVAGFGVALLFAVKRLADVLYGGAAGLLALALLSFGILLPLTGTSLKEDLPAAALATLSMIVLCDSAVPLREPVRWRLAGALAGTALAAKYTVAPYLGIPFVMAAGSSRDSYKQRVAAFLMGAALAFVVFEPYLFIDFPNAVRSFEMLSDHFPGARTTYHMAPRYLLDYWPLGLGVLLMAAAVPAVVSAWLNRGTHSHARKAMVLYLTVLSAVFMWASSGQPRYNIVLAPFLCILVAGEVLRLGTLRRAGSGTILLVALLFTWPANIIAAKYIALLSRPDTRHAAQAWIETEIPAGSTILLEGTVDSEPSYAPALLPDSEWFAMRREEARAAGTSGRILAAAAARAAASDRPRYDLVDASVYAVDNLRSMDYLVMSTEESLPGEFHTIVHPDDPPTREIVQARATAMRRVEEEFTLVASYAPNPVLRFDWFARPDFYRLWAAPIGSFDDWVLGPRIDVYRRVLTPSAAVRSIEEPATFSAR